jgi:hypothetical protein
MKIMKNKLIPAFQKRLLSVIIFVILVSIPLTVLSIVFLQKDQKGNFHYSCEGMVGESMRIKQVDRNTFKVLGRNVGQLISAESPAEAAKIVCGEDIKKPQNTQ